jgi:hypothetical protein
LSTVGQREFVIVMRNYNEVSSSKIKPPSVVTVKLSELEKYLPIWTKRTSPEERQRDLLRRRNGYELLYH